MSYIFSLGSQFCGRIERAIIQPKRYSYAIKRKLFDRINVLMIEKESLKEKKMCQTQFPSNSYHPLFLPISYVVETLTYDAA